MGTAVARVVNTSRSPRATARGDSERRCSGARDSDRRSAAHSATTALATASTPKIHRHVAIHRMPWPTDGASTGTTMNTIITSDMTRAISLPR